MARRPARLAAIQKPKISSLIGRRWPGGRLVSVLALTLLSGTSAAAAVVTVPGGGNLQAAINAAQPGDVIQLQAAATFVGNFLLPAKPGAEGGAAGGELSAPGGDCSRREQRLQCRRRRRDHGPV
jgi:hypothetical protein